MIFYIILAITKLSLSFQKQGIPIRNKLGKSSDTIENTGPSYEQVENTQGENGGAEVEKVSSEETKTSSGGIK